MQIFHAPSLQISDQQIGLISMPYSFIKRILPFETTPVNYFFIPATFMRNLAEDFFFHSYNWIVGESLLFALRPIYIVFLTDFMFL